MAFGKKKPERPRIIEVMRLRNAYLHDPMTPAEAREFEEAKHRCEGCNAKGLCDELIAKGAKDGFALFCPNNHYMQRLRSGSLKFG